MTISTQLTEKDFIRLSLSLIYRTAAVKVITGIGMLMAAVMLGDFMFRYDLSAAPGLIVPLFMLGVMPLSIYISAKKNYSTDQRISERIQYQLEEDYLMITGQSFALQRTWNKIHKVSQSKHFVVIWQTPRMVNAIPKREIGSSEIAQLKAILERQSVKNTL